MSTLVIGIGDLHGHYQALKQILDSLDEKYSVFQDRLPDRLRPDVKLVFTGDYIDRGRHGLAIIERLQRLASQNPGQVVTLMGNHELMALEAYDDAVELVQTHQNLSARGLLAAYEMRTGHGHNHGTTFIREFGATTLPAFESYVARMARDGDIGRWMRSLPPSHRKQVAGRTVLFLHGDLPEELRDRQRLKLYLQRIDQHRRLPTNEVGGSRAKWGNKSLAAWFWDRTFEQLEGTSRIRIDAICRKVGVDFIVTGHTPHPSIKVYGQRIFDIDVGMTPLCGGHQPRALVLGANGIVGFSADGQEQSFVRFGSPAGKGR